MADHTIYIDLVNDKVVVRDSPTGHFWQTYAWCTNADQLTVNFQNGDPFWLQSVAPVTSSSQSSGQEVCGPAVRVVNPLKSEYYYSGVLTKNGVQYPYDPKVIIDGSMGVLALALASVAALATLGVAIGIYRAFSRALSKDSR